MPETITTEDVFRFVLETAAPFQLLAFSVFSFTLLGCLLRLVLRLERPLQKTNYRFEWVDPYEGLNTKGYGYHRHVYRIESLEELEND